MTDFPLDVKPFSLGTKMLVLLYILNKTVIWNWGEETEVYKIYSDLNDLIKFNV